MATKIYVESGSRRVFACAIDWPGWCRSGKDEGRAIDALAAAAPRYALVAEEAGVASPARTAAFAVVERIPGSATTDFGAPDMVAAADGKAVGRKAAERLAALVGASWTVFDMVVTDAPSVLRKGPRGGGRDRDAIVEHVLAAEASYARKLGIRQPQPAVDDHAAIAALREAIRGAIATTSDGTSVVEKGWPLRYAARRLAWHVLDHAWEIEDRSDPPR